MKILKVERQTKKGIDQLEVKFEVDGKEKVIGFDDYNDAISKDKNGKEKFIKVLEEEEKEIKKLKTQSVEEFQKQELSDYKNKEV
jgi:hypothetical protein